VEGKLSELGPIRRALQENEDWYQDLVEHSHDLLCIHDLAGRLLCVNPAPARLLGYSVKELLQIPMRELIAPEIRDQLDVYLAQIEREGEARGLLTLITRSGERRIWEYHNTLRTEGVAVPIVRGTAHDVTEQRETEKRLREVSEQLLSRMREGERTIGELKLFRTLVDHCNDAIEVVDPETLRFLDVNEKACSDLGYSREELLSMGVPDINPAVGEFASAKITEMVRKSGFLVIERVHRRKDGTLFPVEASFRWIHLDRDYVVVIARDITERKRAEARLQEYERVVEGLEENIAVVDRDYRLVIANRAFLNERGLEKEQVVGHSVSELAGAPLFDTVLKPKLDECFQGRVVHYELRKKYAQLGERDVFISYFPIQGPQGVDRIATVLRDITERKQAEEALRRSEESYRMFVSQSSEGIFREEMDAPVSIDLPEDELIHHILCDSYIVECNDALAAMYGLSSAKELQGKHWSEMVPPEDPKNIEMNRQFIRSGFRLLEHESHEIDIHGNPKVLLNSMIGTVENGMLVRTWGIQRDITEKVRLEEARKRAEEAIAALVQVRADSSESFFNSMAIELAKCLQADYAIIGELIEGEEDKVRTIGVCGQGVIAENFTRELAGTPCGFVIERGASSYAAGVTEIFPEDFLLKQMKVEGYAGTPLRDSQGRTIGLMVALYTRPLATAKFAEMILQLFSTRTAAEVERKRTEEALRQSEERFRVALSGSPIKVFNQDRDLRYTWVYNLQEGWTEQDYLGKTDEEIFGPETAAIMEAIKRPVLETGRGARQEFTLTAHGKTYHCDVTVEPLINAAGGVVGVNCSCVDITHLREVTEELRLAKEKLSEEKLYLEEAIDSELGFGEIIGRSSALKEVMAKVAKVAPSDATVLLLGETGTGKELVARALHHQSKRKGNSFIKLNCAAIPSGLLESELFGHEKGAFTGAVARKLGRLELADRGTLFLDEIGEIPLSLQPKLLRVLQDQEFERLGGTQTLKVNFRLLAATNRELLKSVKAYEFRSDLYYRLNVFPIYIPPLRERREDIRPLVEHFVRKFAGQMKKSIISIPVKMMEALVRWDWPGNIRELENFMERSVILTPGSVLQAPLSELQPPGDAGNGGKIVSLRDKERERIVRVLRECHGRLGGPDGAAARLGLKRTTLQSKLDQLGIKPKEFRA
jgi:PAS domain S-box-containing protein